MALVPIRLVFPLPPIENHLYATVNGRRVKSAEARQYELDVSVWTSFSGYGPRDVPDGPLSLTIALYLKWDRDVTGCKCLQDSLATALGFDDKRIARLVVTKAIDKTNPRAEVTLMANAA